MHEEQRLDEYQDEQKSSHLECSYFHVFDIYTDYLPKVVTPLYPSLPLLLTGMTLPLVHLGIVLHRTDSTHTE